MMLNIILSSYPIDNTIGKAYRLELRIDIAESANLFNRKHLVWICIVYSCILSMSNAKDR